LRFQKKGTLRFISHHDLMRLLERALRRAELPIKMTQGFNPRPRMSFPLALALGVEGLEEIVELELSRWLPPKTLVEQLRTQLPEGLDIISAEPVATSSRVEEVVYQVKLHSTQTITPEKIEELLNLKEYCIWRERDGKKKVIDLRPSILSITLKEGCLEIRFKVLQEGTARPEEVLEALGLRSPVLTNFNIARVKVLLSPTAVA
jgi:radical SAM-linked protein